MIVCSYISVHYLIIISRKGCFYSLLSMSTSDSLKISKFYNFNGATYMYVKNTSDGRDPVIVTDTMFLNIIDKTDSTVTFHIQSIQSDVLYKMVTELESRLAVLLSNLTADDIAKLPSPCQDVFHTDAKCKDMIRPNYFGEHNPTMYLKGNLGVIKIVDNNGQPLSSNQLGDGDYKFEISAHKIYCGPHVLKDNMSSIQLRIKHIMYRPLVAAEVTGVATMKPKRKAKKVVKEQVRIFPSNIPASELERIPSHMNLFEYIADDNTCDSGPSEKIPRLYSTSNGF